MPHSIRFACAIALAGVLAAGLVPTAALAQGLLRDRTDERRLFGTGERRRLGTGERRRFRTFDPLVEAPRTAEPRSSDPTSSDPSEGERRERRDGARRDGAREPAGERAIEANGEARAAGAPQDPSLAFREDTALAPRIGPAPLLVPTPEPLEADGDAGELVEPEIGPYDPLGVRIGSLLFFPDVSVETLYTDNVFESALVRKSDTALAVEPRAVLRSNWSRHSLSGELNGLFSFFREYSSENEKDVDSALRGRLDVTRRTNVEAETTYQLEQESRSSVNIPDAAAERPDEETLTGALQVNHRINRVRLRVRGEVVEETFQDVTLLDGEQFDNSGRDNTERELTGRVGYEFKPDVAAFVQGSVNEIEYERPTIEDGVVIRRDSTGYEVQAGLSFELGGNITGEIAAGYARQTPDESTLSDLEGPILNANLAWRATGLTTVTLNAQSGIDASISTDSPGSLNQTIQLDVEHVLRRRLVLGASLAYEIDEFGRTDEFGGSDEKQHELIASLSADYFLTRSLGLTARYTYDKFNGAGGGDNDYTENEFRVGVRVRR